MGTSPILQAILERLHCFQSEQYYYRYRGIDADPQCKRALNEHGAW